MEKKYLGIDLGERRVGLAISDGLGLLAHPYRTIPWVSVSDFVQKLGQIIPEENITAVIAGVPYTMKGERSQKTIEILEIIADLRQHLDIPVIEIDERLTTRMAHDILRSAGRKPSRMRHAVDQVAAVLILQTFLDQGK